jgi:hypothetical protein
LNQFDGSRFSDFNARMTEADNILKSLREKGMYAEATFADLASTLQLTAGGMFTAGIKDGQKQVDMIVAVSQALAALGGDQQNLASELRALTTGNVDGFHRVAKAIGMTGEQLRKAQADGKLFEMVMSKMSPILADAEQGMGTFQSQVTILQETLDTLKTDLAEPMFEALKAGLQQVNASFKGDEFKEGLKGAASEIGKMTAAAMSMAAGLLQALPTIINIASSLTSLLVPALVAVGFAKISASAKTQALNTSLMTLGKTGIASATMAWKTFQYNLLFMPTVTGKVTQSFRLMFASISTGMKGMAASAMAGFKAMAASGMAAAIAIQGALALVTAAFSAAMSWANEKNQTTDEQQSIMKDGSKQFKANANRVKNVSSEKERGEISADLETQREAIREKINDVSSRDISDENKNTLIEQYQRELQAVDMIQKSLGKVTAERMRQNLLAQEAATQAEKDAAAREAMREKVKEAGDDLAESKKKSDFNAMSPQEQRASLFKGVMGGAFPEKHTNEELDSQIGSLQSKFDNNTATAAESERLLNLISVKIELLNVDKDIAAENEKAAKEKQKNLEAQKQAAIELAALEAEAKGDTKGKEKAERNQKYGDLFKEQKSMGYNDQDAEKNANNILKLQDKIKQNSQAKDRSSFESEMKIKEAKASGNTAEADRLEKEKKKSSLVAEQKAMGYGDKEANANADKMLLYEDAIKAQSEMKNGKKDSSPLAASSTMAVGGGGVSVGMGTGLLDETRKQTNLLQQIANSLKGGPTGNGTPAKVSAWQSLA